LNSQVRDVSDITVQHDYLPRSRTVMALMHIRADPLAHFMPTITNERGTFFCAAPPGMPKELNNLFMFPTHVPPKTRRERPATVGSEGPSPKRPRLATEDPEVEVGRRDPSVARSLGVGSDVFGRNGHAEGGDVSFGGLGVEDDFQMGMDDGGEFNIDLEGAMEDARRRASKAGSVPAPSVIDDGALAPMDEDRRSRYSTPADGLGENRETYSDLVCLIAVFDHGSKDSQTRAQSEEPVDAEEGPNKDNYSKNTVKALHVLRKHFGSADNDATPRRRAQAPADKMISFTKLSEKASRRAAASFFFELLVLGTKDCVKLNQANKFENIEIRAKEKMWKVDAARQPSVAPSNA